MQHSPTAHTNGPRHTSMKISIEMELVSDPALRERILLIATQFAPALATQKLEVRRFSHPNAAYNSNVYQLGEVVLKEVRGWRLKMPGMAQGLAELTEFLRQNGIPVPQSLLVNGNALVQSGGSNWVAYHAIPADHYFRGDVAEQRALGALLARVHRGMRAFHATNPDSVLFQVGLPAKNETHYTAGVVGARELDTALAQMNGAPDLNGESARFRELVHSEAEELRCVIQFIAGKLEPEAMTSNAQPIHGYVHPQNVLVSDGVQPALALLDFETVVIANPEMCLGSALLECVPQGAALTGGAAGELADALVQSYAADMGIPVDPSRIAAFACNRAVTAALLNIRRHFLERQAGGDFNFDKHILSAGVARRLLVGAAL